MKLVPRHEVGTKPFYKNCPQGVNDRYEPKHHLAFMYIHRRHEQEIIFKKIVFRIKKTFFIAERIKEQHASSTLSPLR
jgi:hypothetical protein